MQYRHLFPMVRILLPFLVGIIVSTALSATLEIPLPVWIGLLIVTISAALLPFKNLRIVKQLFFGIFSSLFLFVSGYNLVLLHKEILRPGHFSKLQDPGIYIASVNEPLQEKEHSYKTILKVKAVKQGNRLIKADGRILTYFAKDSTITPPAEGSLIAFSAKISPISGPQNPGAFNYQAYMASNNVYHQVYLNNHSWKLLQPPQGFSLRRVAHQISDRFISILHHNGLKGREFTVAAALILGQKDMLDNETLQAYSGTGVMHILCVSGLHVGVIYFFISFGLRFLKKKGWQVCLKTTIILLTIWAYALLTGMSPSVMRSAVMFTFISLGNASNRYVHIVNSLAVSAFVLLLYDPLMISNIGFQLSYIAILGIVFINKPIASLWEPRNRVSGYIWNLIAVSIAAQIATAPLAMFYFHQFPVYFIPGNLVAIPMSFLAIHAGIGVLLFSFIPVVSNFFGTITNYLLLFLNTSVAFIEHLPNAVLKITAVFTPEMLLVYLLIISAGLYGYLKRKEWLFASFALALLLAFFFSFTEIRREQQEKIVFYSAGKQTAIGFFQGKQHILLADSVLITDTKARKFQIDGTKTLYGTTAETAFALDTVSAGRFWAGNPKSPLQCLGPHFLFHNKRISVIDSLPRVQGNIHKLAVDYLLIHGNPRLRVADLGKLYQPGLIIIDGSNSYYKAEKWTDELTKAGFKTYNLRNEGALVVDL